MTRALTSRVWGVIVIIFRERLCPDAVHPTRIVDRYKTPARVSRHKQRPAIEALFDCLRHPTIVRNHLSIIL